MIKLFDKCTALLASLVLTASAVAQTVAVNLNQVRQGVDGAGFCHEGDRQNGNNYVFDTRIQQMLDNHMSLFRDMFPNKTWEPSKGTFGYNDQRVINSFLRLKEMQNRGIKTILGIWDVPNWLVTNPSAGSGRRINNMDDFADFITSYLVRAKNVYGLNVDYVDVNETKTSGVNIYLEATEYISLIQKCQTRFTANGITTKMNMGSTLLWDLAYNQQIYNATHTLSVAGNPSWHTYRGGSTTGREPISYWEQWGAWRQSIDRNLWGTETEYDAFYWDKPECLNWTGVEEMAVVYWRNWYVARMSTSAGWFWRTDYPSHNVHLAYMNHFQPGGQIVEASQPSGDIMTVAYKHVANNKFVMQVLNQANGTRTVTFTGVPSGKPLTLKRTSAAGDRSTIVGTYTPSGTTLTITLQADSFNTFYGELGTTGPTDTVAPSVPANLVSTGKTANSISLSWNASTDNVGVAGYQIFNAANAQVGSSNTTTATVTGLNPSTSYTLNAKAYDAAGNFSAASNSVTVLTDAGTSPNIAYQRPVWTSSIQGTGFEGSKAVDANGNTRWASATANNQSIIVDLGANYNVNRVRIAWEAAYARDYQIQFSTNNSTWTTVREFWGKNSSAADNQTGLSGTTRYVKIYCINRATSYGFSIFEIEAYGTPAN